MKRIYKYEVLLLFAHQIITMPKGKNVLLSEQDGAIFLWREFSDEDEFNIYDYNICVHETGSEIQDGEIFIGSVNMRNGDVWHVYEAKK